MGTMEIILLIVGLAVFVASFFLPSGKGDKPVINKELTKEEIRSLVADELESIRNRVDDTAQDWPVEDDPWEDCQTEAWTEEELVGGDD